MWLWLKWRIWTNVQIFLTDFFFKYSWAIYTSTKRNERHDSMMRTHINSTVSCLQWFSFAHLLRTSIYVYSAQTWKNIRLRISQVRFSFIISHTHTLTHRHSILFSFCVHKVEGLKTFDFNFQMIDFYCFHRLWIVKFDATIWIFFFFFFFSSSKWNYIYWYIYFSLLQIINSDWWHFSTIFFCELYFL